MSELDERAAGCLVGQAYGDALGVPYEAGVRPLDYTPELLGGGLGDYEQGEWSDDTDTSICVAQAALDADLATDAGLNAVAARLEDWYAGRPADVGLLTSRVLHDAELLTGSPAARLRAAARAVPGHTAGNGALARTAPVGLALHGDSEAITATARAIAELTHSDPLAGDSCVLWSLAIDAVLRGEPADLAAQVGALPAQRRDRWTAWIAEADDAAPSTFAENTYTVTALQTAWSAVRKSIDSNFLQVIGAAIGAGGDTDTVAAIAGALAGAMYGLTAVRDQRISRVYGWPGMTTDDLAELAHQLVRRSIQR